MELIATLASGVVGAVAGAVKGSSVGIAMGPAGAIAGTIPGAIIGGAMGLLAGNNVGHRIDSGRQNRTHRRIVSHEHHGRILPDHPWVGSTGLAPLALRQSCFRLNTLVVVEIDIRLSGL